MKKYGVKHVSATYFPWLNPVRKISKNNKSQLLLIGGVLTTILILSMAMISISIPDITKPVYKKDFILYEYTNVREEFGVLLKGNLKKVVDNIIDKDSFIDYGEAHFTETKDMFIFIEKSHGNYFNAEYDPDDPLFFSSGPPKTVEITLTLKNEKEIISEVVTYEIEWFFL